jgi:protein-tyrosine kinase
MDHIRQAVERARANPQVRDNLDLPPIRHVETNLAPAATTDLEADLNSSHLLSNLIVSHNGADPRSRPFDMLRTQVLQSMSMAAWKVVGITSPTPNCGKTLTAINLAFSIARQQEQAVVLVDMDLQRPEISNCIGVDAENNGLLGILEHQATLRSTVIRAHTGNQRLFVLPTASAKVSSELIGSRAMHDVLRDLRQAYQIVILDLPPLLTGDDVLRTLPEIDCVLLVAAEGLSTASEVQEAMRHLQSGQLVRLVLNKATEKTAPYYY